MDKEQRIQRLMLKHGIIDDNTVMDYTLEVIESEITSRLSSMVDEQGVMTEDELGSGWNIDMGYTEYLNSVKITVSRQHALDKLHEEQVTKELNHRITVLEASLLDCKKQVEQAVLDKLNMTPDKMRKLDNILTEIYSWGASTERSGYYDPDEAQESIKEYTNQIISLCQPSPDKVREMLMKRMGQKRVKCKDCKSTDDFINITKKECVDCAVKEICGG